MRNIRDLQSNLPKERTIREQCKEIGFWRFIDYTKSDMILCIIKCLTFNNIKFRYVKILIYLMVFKVQLLIFITN